MNFCGECGAPTEKRIPDGDNRERDVCTSCGSIFYSNPKNVCGCILEHEGKVLLCKRAIEPRYGYWTVPAGFMENNETTAEGAAREARHTLSVSRHSRIADLLVGLPSFIFRRPYQTGCDALPAWPALTRPKPAHRFTCQLSSHEPWRKHRHAYSGQVRIASWIG